MAGELSDAYAEAIKHCPVEDRNGVLRLATTTVETLVDTLGLALTFEVNAAIDRLMDEGQLGYLNRANHNPAWTSPSINPWLKTHPRLCHTTFGKAAEAYVRKVLKSELPVRLVASEEKIGGLTHLHAATMWYADEEGLVRYMESHFNCKPVFVGYSFSLKP
jgi:hypothetical protein